MSTLGDTSPYALSFGEALWSLTNRLEATHTLAISLANQYYNYHGNGVTKKGAANSMGEPPPIILESMMRLPPLRCSSRGLPMERQLLVLAEKPPRVCPSFCPSLLNGHTPETVIFSAQQLLDERRPIAQAPQKGNNLQSHCDDTAGVGDGVPSVEAVPGIAETSGSPIEEARKSPNRLSDKSSNGVQFSDDQFAGLADRTSLRSSGVNFGQKGRDSTNSWLPGRRSESGESDFGDMQAPLLILRKVWLDEAQTLKTTEITNFFKVSVCKNTDTIVQRVPPRPSRMSMFGRGRTGDLERHSQRHSVHASQESLQQGQNFHQGSYCIIHPMSWTRLSWCFMTMLMIVWDVLFIPIEAFPVPELVFFVGMEWFITFFWTADIAVNFRTGYMKGPQVELRSSRIAVKYFRTWFIPDVLIVAMEWGGRLMTTIVEGGSLTRITRVFRAFRSVRLLRLTKLTYLLNTIEDQVNAPAFQLLFALTKMTALLCLILHFVTCLWFLIGDYRNDGWVGYANVPPCGVRPPSNGRDPMPEDQNEAIMEFALWYFYSARWVAAQANGRVDQDERRNLVEMGFTTFLAVVGPIICISVFVSKITATMLELNSMAESRRSTRMRLNAYLSDHHVSATLTSRLKQHLRERKDFNQEQEAEQFVLSIFPKQLQNDLLYEVRAPTVVAHRFFNAINVHFPQAIKHVTMQALKPILTHQNETIFETGDACSRMIFAYRGRFIYSQVDKSTHQRIMQKASDAMAMANLLEEEADEDQMAQEVGTGVWLSEAAIWLEWQNQGILTAVNDGLFFCLDVEAFKLVVHGYLDVLALVVAYALRFESSLKDQKSLSDIIDMEFESFFNGNSKKSVFVRKTQTSNASKVSSIAMAARLTDLVER